MLFPTFDPSHGDPLVPDEPGLDPQEAAFLRGVAEDPDDDAPRLIFADWLEENGRADKAAFVRWEVELSRLPRSSPRYESLRDELLRLDGLIDGPWTWAFLRPRRLLNCGDAPAGDRVLRFTYQCPNRWTDLKPLPQNDERYCPQCRKNVHFCASKDEAEAHAAQGHCIAIGSLLALGIKKRYGPAPTPEEPAEPQLSRTGGFPPSSSVDDDVEMGDVNFVGMPALPPSPYERWAQELFARHPERAKRWWQFWK
jgi:uncharacterized protein (TIGR02996 family)